MGALVAVYSHIGSLSLASPILRHIRSLVQRTTRWCRPCCNISTASTICKLSNADQFRAGSDAVTYQLILQAMDNSYKEYSSLKNLNCSNWSNAYGLDTECPGAKWACSAEAAVDYNSAQPCYYQNATNITPGVIKSEYDSMYETASGCLTENVQTFKTYNSTYADSDVRALASQSVLSSSPSSTGAPVSQQSGTVACPPDSTFASPTDSGHVSKAGKSTQSNRQGKGKSDKQHKSQCSSSGSYEGKGDEGLNRKVTLRPHSTPATLMWLENNYELAEGVCIPRSVLYLHYVDFCSLNRVQPVNAASFGKIIRQQFPHLTTRRLGTRGQSRYHYYGIGIRDSSPFYQLSYSKKSVQMHSITEATGKSHKGGSVYSRYHQTKMHQGKLASKMSAESKLHRGTVDSASMYYATDGANVGQTSAAASQEMTSCHSSQMYTNFSSSSKHYRGILADKFEFNGAQVADQFGQLSPGVSSCKASPNGNLMSTFVPSLPPFPTAEELELCHGTHSNLVSTFLLMYRAHCQRILDAVVRANFEELNTLIFHFWQKIPHHLTPILASSLLINLIGICDIRTYRTIVKLISVTLAQPLTEIAYSQLENFVSNLDTILSTALHRESVLLQQVKVELACHFAGIVKCLLRHSRVYHSVQGQSTSANCQAALKQLNQDWSRLEMSTLCDQLVEQYARMSKFPINEHNCLKRVHQILYRHCAEFKLFLASFTDYSQLFEWFENVWQVSLQWYHSCVPIKGATFGLEFAKHFLVLWTCARLRIGQELNRIKAPSENLFITLSGLFDDFCVYKVKDLYFDDCTSLFFSNAAKNAKPTLPQYFEPLDLMKQTAAFLENCDTADGNEWCSAGGQITRTGSVAYQEMYGSALHSNALWFNYGQQAASSSSSSSANYYQESGQQMYGPTYSDGGEYGNSGTEQQQRPPRQDSLICFSMNFHANSIQVMTAPSTTSSTSTISQRTEAGGEEAESGPYVSSSEGGHFNSPSSSTAGSLSHPIKCYLSPETCHSAASDPSSASTSTSSNLYSL